MPVLVLETSHQPKDTPMSKFFSAEYWADEKEITPLLYSAFYVGTVSLIGFVIFLVLSIIHATPFHVAACASMVALVIWAGWISRMEREAKKPGSILDRFVFCLLTAALITSFLYSVGLLLLLIQVYKYIGDPTKIWWLVGLFVELLAGAFFIALLGKRAVKRMNYGG